MASLRQITDFLNEYLAVDDIDDSCWNGLQFEGVDKVKNIAFAVDAGRASFEEALACRADMLIVHHGHFWTHQNPSISSWSKDRLKILYENEISLYACHLPLDRHPKVGNNAEIIRILGAKVKDPFYMHKGKNVGWTGVFKKPRTMSEIVKTLNDKLGSISTVVSSGGDRVESVAVCSGGGSYGGFNAALEEGVDLYITGDTAEVYQTARDSGLSVVFAGHYATETVGLKALSIVLGKKFDVKTKFIDLPTGL